MLGGGAIQSSPTHKVITSVTSESGHLSSSEIIVNDVQFLAYVVEIHHATREQCTILTCENNQGAKKDDLLAASS